MIAEKQTRSGDMRVHSRETGEVLFNTTSTTSTYIDNVDTFHLYLFE